MTTAIAMPQQVATLDRDKHGRPIPWFVHRNDDGTPDFRVVRKRGIADAVRRNLCWVCGTDRGREVAFVIGPMCSINRISPEPPSHRACATYSANACPFLSTPHMRRRETGLPEDRLPQSVGYIARNPGVACVWFGYANKWSPKQTPDGGLLFNIGEPSRVSWYAHGRRATRDEIMAAIDSGYPLLLEAAEQDGPDAVAMLEHDRDVAMRLVPAA